VICRQYSKENKRCKVLLAQNFMKYKTFICSNFEDFEDCVNLKLHKKLMRIKIKRRN
jgi:hypothetical protein